MGSLDERVRRVLQHEQRTNHADVAVKPGGLTLFFANWTAEARAFDHPYAERFATLFADYATSDPMQRSAKVRAALALLANSPQEMHSNDSMQKSTASVGTVAIATAPMKTAQPQRPKAVTVQATSNREPQTASPVKGPKTAVVKLTPAKKAALTSHASPGEPVGEYLLDAPVTVVSGVGPSVAEKFAKLGITTVRDLLYHFPREHLDYSNLQKINELAFDETMTTLGIIWDVENVRTSSKRMTRTVARISDESGEIRAVWFNQPYLQKQLPKGAQIVLTGVKQRFGNAVHFTVKSFELPDKGDLVSTGRLVPVYPLTEGLSAKTLRKATKWVVDRCATLVRDYLPESVQQSVGLLPLPQALAEYHYPHDPDSLAAARHRLAFDEMFIVQLGMLARRGNYQIGPPAPAIHIDRSRIVIHGEQNAPDASPPQVQELAQADPIPVGGLWGELIATATCFEASLPFTFTEAQQRVIGEILDDMQRDIPMCRLVQGDVGSGKTAVAAAALLAAALSGYQGAIMAPTEILAEQHFRAFTRMFAPFGIEVVALLGSQRTRQRAESLQAIESGRASIVVGTHALIQESVTFARLGMAVVDEQHRFGVEQRELLRRKGRERSPHLLVMTATPIPRTLALAVYGDLDLSVIDQMPRGRRPIITRWFAGSRREEAYQQMAWEVAQGRQGYIICPLIEESEAIEAKAAVVEYERLRTDIFPQLRMGLVHGGLKSQEKDATMRGFRDGEIDILVATAVVEVGVDVPNATLMIIEDADRFGLAQLHQFRGRVGRGDDQSYCYLLSQDASALARERLTVVEQTTDGFKLAEADLFIRGPGEFFGTRQSGLPELRVAELTDGPLITQARAEAERLWSIDPFLKSSENSALRVRMATFWQHFMAQ